MVGQNKVVQQFKLVARTCGVMGVVDGPVEQEGAEHDVSEGTAGDSRVEEAVPAVALDLADVVQQGTGEQQVSIGRRGEPGRSQRQVGDFAGVLQQPAESGVMSVGAGRTTLETGAKGLVIK